MPELSPQMKSPYVTKNGKMQTMHSGPNQGFLSNGYIIKYGTECWSVCRVAAECAHGCCRMCAGLQSYQIFSQISQKYFLAQKNILSKKWPPKQNLKGVSKSYIGLCNHSGPLHKVTWWCMVVQELPKALLKMASGLISPSGHCGQLCNVKARFGQMQQTWHRCWILYIQ